MRSLRKFVSVLAIVLIAATTPAQDRFTFETQLRTPFARTASGGSLEPQLFFTPSARLYVLTAIDGGKQTGLAVFVSDDLGATFSRQISIPTEGDVMTHGEMSPVIGYDPTAAQIYVAWQSGRELMFSHGSPFGKSLSAPLAINKTLTSSSAGYVTIGVAPDGRVAVAWLDGSDKDNKRGTTSVYVTTSTDQGATFDTPRRIGSNACPCCRPSMAFDENGNAYVAWRDVFERNERDFVVARGDAKTFAFTQPTRISEDGWQIDGCPDSGATLTWLDGRLYAAWFTLGRTGDPQLRFASSDGTGAFSKPLILSHGIDDANHPRFVWGARVPTLVFEGERPLPNHAFGPAQLFVATIPSGGRMQVQPVAKVTSDGFYGYAAGMPNAETLVVAAAVSVKGKPQIVIARARTRRP